MLTVQTGKYNGPADPSPWKNYLSTQVMPVLNGLMTGASENDKQILSTMYGVLLDTTNPGTDVSYTISDLWMTYNTDYRPSLQSSKIRVTADQTLYRARQYVASHP